MNPATGVLTGIPEDIGNTNVTFIVQDSSIPQQTATKALTLTITSRLFISTTALPGGVVGQTLSTTLAAQGGTAPYTWSTLGLPEGFNLNPNSGVLSGIPTGTGNAVVTFVIRDSSNPQQTATKTLTLTITSGLIISTSALPGGVVGQTFSSSLAVQGGTEPYTWSAQGLPAGLSLNATTGLLSGIPTSPGNPNVTFTVRDSSSPQQTATKTLTLAITSGLIIITSALPGGVVGQTFSYSLAVQGGTGPYTWSAQGLPAGLSLNATTGLLSGIPTSPGNPSVAFTARDSSNPQQTATKTLTLAITSGLIVSTSALPGGVVGQTYPSVSIEAQGGTEPYRWQSNGLPEGLNLSEQGALSGTPSRAGSFPIVVTVTDSSQKTASREFTLTVALPATPSFSVSASGQPTSGAEQLDLTFSSDKPYPLPIDAEFRITFVPNAAGIPEAGYVSPSLQFVSGGRTATITVPANSTSLPMPAVQTGDVAGTITVTMMGARVSGTGETLVLPPAPPSTTLTVPRVSPKILPGSVQFVDISPTGFGIQVVATSTPRDLTSVNYNFLARSGTQLSGSSSTVQLGELSKTWFEGSTGQGAGGSFVLKVLFPFSGGDPREFIGSVSVSLGNSVGTSGPVTGVP